VRVLWARARQVGKLPWRHLHGTCVKGEIWKSARRVGENEARRPVVERTSLVKLVVGRKEGRERDRDCAHTDLPVTYKRSPSVTSDRRPVKDHVSFYPSRKPSILITMMSSPVFHSTASTTTSVPVRDEEYYFNNGDCIIRAENYLFKVRSSCLVLSWHS
jgi:hypothetical protein